MASIVIGGNAAAEEIERCSYVFTRFPATELNGLGEATNVGYPEITITYSSLSLTGFAWWASTICANLASKTHTSATLYNDQSATAAYTNLVVHYPTYSGISGQFYQNVVVRITQIS